MKSISEATFKYGVTVATYWRIGSGSITVVPLGKAYFESKQAVGTDVGGLVLPKYTVDRRSDFALVVYHLWSPSQSQMEYQKWNTLEVEHHRGGTP